VSAVNADFRDADLTNCKFAAADLTNAKFDGATFKNTSFVGATGIKWRDVALLLNELGKANFWNAAFSGELAEDVGWPPSFRERIEIFLIRHKLWDATKVLRRWSRAGTRPNPPRRLKRREAHAG
jgi:hypothetical protein